MKLSELNITTEAVNEPPRIVLFGAPKVGKSTIACQSDNPLTISLEKGVKNMKTHNVFADSLDMFKDIVMALIEDEHEYKTLVIDHVTGLEQLIHKKLCEVDGVDSIEKVQKGYGKGFTMSVELLAKILTVLDRLVEEKGMSILFLGHSKIENKPNTLGDDYKIQTVDANQKFTAMLTKWSDANIFMDHKVYTVKEDKGFNQKDVKASMAGRVLYTGECAGAMTGNRYGMPTEIPITKENGWELIKQAIVGETK